MAVNHDSWKTNIWKVTLMYPFPAQKYSWIIIRFYSERSMKFHSLSTLDLFDFPGGSEGKASACNVGDPGLIPGSGRSPGEGNGNPLQYSCLENPTDGGAWWAAVHGVTESETTEQPHFYCHFQTYFENIKNPGVCSPVTKCLLAQVSLWGPWGCEDNSAGCLRHPWPHFMFTDLSYSTDIDF